jgi:hypothetical protein
MTHNPLITMNSQLIEQKLSARVFLLFNILCVSIFNSILNYNIFRFHDLLFH